jgi:sulfoxide reductase heme-binding subunit YedZ
VIGDIPDHSFWLASRSVGVIALLLISLSVCLGLAMSARVTRGPGVAARAKSMHEALALAGLAAIGLHGALLLGDAWLHPTLAQIVTPFAIAPHRIWTGVGVLAGWLTALITASFYARRWIGARNWRRLHMLTFVVYVMGVGHAIGAGTDGGSVWMLATIAAAALPILVLLALRVARPKRAAKRRPAAPARPAVPAPQ